MASVQRWPTWVRRPAVRCRSSGGGGVRRRYRDRCRYRRWPRRCRCSSAGPGVPAAFPAPIRCSSAGSSASWWQVRLFHCYLRIHLIGLYWWKYRRSNFTVPLESGGGDLPSEWTHGNWALKQASKIRTIGHEFMAIWLQTRQWKHTHTHTRQPAIVDRTSMTADCPAADVIPRPIRDSVARNTNTRAPGNLTLRRVIYKITPKSPPVW